MKITKIVQATYEMVEISNAGKPTEFLHFGPGVWYRIKGREIKKIQSPEYLEFLYRKALAEEKERKPAVEQALKGAE